MQINKKYTQYTHNIRTQNYYTLYPLKNVTILLLKYIS